MHRTSPRRTAASAAVTTSSARSHPKLGPRLGLEAGGGVESRCGRGRGMRTVAVTGVVRSLRRQRSVKDRTHALWAGVGAHQRVGRHGGDVRGWRRARGRPSPARRRGRSTGPRGRGRRAPPPPGQVAPRRSLAEPEAGVVHEQPDGGLGGGAAAPRRRRRRPAARGPRRSTSTRISGGLASSRRSPRGTGPRRATRTRSWARRASCQANSSRGREDAPVTSAVSTCLKRRRLPRAWRRVRLGGG